MKKRRENPDKKKEIINKYDATSDYYDRRYSEIQYQKYEIVLKDFILRDKVILDAGCGTGLLYNFIINSIEKDNYIKYFYVGSDISINMLKNFELKLDDKNNKFKCKIHLLLADLENLPIRNNIFDSIFSLTSLQNLPHIIDGFKELFRVIKDDADIKFSILKKNLDLNKLVSILKPKIYDLQIINKEIIEDVIIQGKTLKLKG